VPHPFHVLCEMGGKPQNQPHKNYENALAVESQEGVPIQTCAPSYSTSSTRHFKYSVSGKFSTTG
jgi:hypothetical protein